MLRPIVLSLSRALRKTPFHPQWLLPSREWAENALGNIGSGRVLDIGCADRWVERALGPECRYIGLDYPATGARLYQATPDVFADAASLPFPSGCLDAVVMLEVLEHLERPEAALAEVARVLAPGGIVLISMPFLYPIHDAPYDFQRYTEHGLKRSIRLAGLDLIDICATANASRSAGLLACLAIAGVAERSLATRPLIAIIPLLFAAMSIPLINLVAMTAGMLFPSWSALTLGYRLVATKSVRS